MPAVFFAGLAVSEILFVSAVWALALMSGYTRKEAFAAGLISLGCLYCIGLTQYARMDLMFTAHAGRQWCLNVSTADGGSTP